MRLRELDGPVRCFEPAFVCHHLLRFGNRTLTKNNGYPAAGNLRTHQHHPCLGVHRLRRHWVGVLHPWSHHPLRVDEVLHNWKVEQIVEQTDERFVTCTLLNFVHSPNISAPMSNAPQRKGSDDGTHAPSHMYLAPIAVPPPPGRSGGGWRPQGSSSYIEPVHDRPPYNVGFRKDVHDDTYEQIDYS